MNFMNVNETFSIVNNTNLQTEFRQIAKKRIIMSIGEVETTRTQTAR